MSFKSHKLNSYKKLRHRCLSGFYIRLFCEHENTAAGISSITGVLTLSWRRPFSYRNQSIDLHSKSMDRFLYDNGLRHERANKVISNTLENINENIICGWQALHLCMAGISQDGFYQDKPKSYFLLDLTV